MTFALSMRVYSKIARSTKMKKQTNSTIKAHLLRGAFYLLLLLAVCAIPFALAQPGSIVTGIPTSSGVAPSRASHPAAAGLSFADRVAYQSAIEDVYWRHRIWPKERPGLFLFFLDFAIRSFLHLALRSRSRRLKAIIYHTLKMSP